MEDIFQTLIFLAFAILSFLPALKKGKKSQDAQPQPQPFFPEDELEDAFPDGVEDDVSVESFQQEIKATPFKRIQIPVEEKVKEPAPLSEEKSCKDAGKKVRLSSRHEAKRAFIYSEIFNRKYL